MGISRILRISSKVNNNVKVKNSLASNTFKFGLQEMLRDELEQDVMKEDENMDIHNVAVYILSNGYIGGLNTGNIVG